jgi:Flp pilus assembly protein TadG
MLRNHQINRRSHFKSTGAAVIYVAFAAIVLFGLASVAVDFGRVQAAKMELHDAVDAAARAGASSLSSGPSSAVSAAVSTASENRADGISVSISSTSDVDLGTWDPTAHTFTVLTGSAQSNANAVRVRGSRTAAKGNAIPLLFGQIIGQRTCDVNVMAVAYFEPGPVKYQVVGLTSVTMSSSSSTSSYQSSTDPDAASAGNHGSIASNGNLNIDSSSLVNGNIYSGPNASASWGGNGSTGAFAGGLHGCGNSPCTGSQVCLKSDISCATPQCPSNCANLGNVACNGSRTVNLPPGNYCCNSINVTNGTLTLNCGGGCCNLYCTGDCNCSNGGMCCSNGGSCSCDSPPCNLCVNMCNTHNCSCNLDHCCIKGTCNCPCSHVSLNSSQICGAVIGSDLTLTNGSSIKFDTTLGVNGDNTTTGNVTLVE